MRLCARAQPANIRMTRRRSVLPSSSSSIPKEDHLNGCSEGNGLDGHGYGLPSIGLTTVVPYQLQGADANAIAPCQLLHPLVRRRPSYCWRCGALGKNIGTRRLYSL